MIISAGERSTVGRAMFDSGAGVSIVTSRLANLLKARRISRPTQITGLAFNLNMVQLTLSSIHNSGGETRDVLLHVIEEEIPVQTPDLESIRQLPFLHNKVLADWNYCRTVDLLLSVDVMPSCLLPEVEINPGKTLEARNFIFGWIVSGHTGSFLTDHQLLNVESSDDLRDDLLQRFWRMEELPSQVNSLTAEEDMAMDFFNNIVERNSEGRYVVQLPQKTPAIESGDSKKTALRRFYSNRHFLKQKGTWDSFKIALEEYLAMDHAELVPPDEVDTPFRTSFYLPMHGVEKPSSTTTKLRVVFDASAKSSCGFSLNDTLLTGPCTYPHINTVLTRFRRHIVGLSADISKMFREVVLNRVESDYHRFIIEDPSNPDNITICRMKHLTFGVACSPFLATAVLRHLAEDYEQEYLEAAALVRENFYVDDLLTGAESP